MSDYSMDTNAYPFSDTKAALMIREALAQAKSNDRLSLGKVADSLGISGSQLSHMASGRVAIPMNHALLMAEALHINLRAFVIAVFEQRHPNEAGLIAPVGTSLANGRRKALLDEMAYLTERLAEVTRLLQVLP